MQHAKLDPAKKAASEKALLEATMLLKEHGVLAVAMVTCWDDLSLSCGVGMAAPDAEDPSSMMQCARALTELTHHGGEVLNASMQRHLAHAQAMGEAIANPEAKA